MRRQVCLWAGLIALSWSATVAGAGPFPWARVPDVRVDDFRPDFLERVARRLESLPCYGRCQGSIAACLQIVPVHPTAARLARDVLLLMAQESTDADVVKWIETRRAMAHPKPEDMRDFQLDGQKPLGPADAPVVVVEFSDFECPFCSQIVPILEQLARTHGKVRLYAKQFPIKGHAHALGAAKACVASDRFGKFWEYCPRLWELRADLSEERLVKLAVELGMEAAAFRAAMGSEEVLNRIADEKLEGLKNRVQGTPAIFVNGKEFLLQPSPRLLKDRIDEELDILQGRD
ncbi:MAG TPA: thioredoxin domain-containing protein [Myxococcota bacterium]|nr:thioredoxin domain-containing protein [Myxococcota bacterium]HRY95420.1 thioredoxin domain-containing protein [Myxococcota bacterium]HSA23450.1 thioredoxin domain-containing protein [Myxococcota bacterium]